MMRSNWFPIGLGVLVLAVVLYKILIHPGKNQPSPKQEAAVDKALKKDSSWVAPDLALDSSLSEQEKKSILYGKDLIANTAKYYGP